MSKVSIGKTFGSIYFILGTSIAAGMLGLPIVMAHNHFYTTMVMLFTAWALMTTGAWCFLQVNLGFKEGANIITMTKALLPRYVVWFTWLAYLLLLYSLICAYLAASGDLLQTLCIHFHIQLPRWLATVAACSLLGAIVYKGIAYVDMSNRVLMSIKLVVCLVIISFVFPHDRLYALTLGDYKWRMNGFLVMICSFGYAVIIPSIRSYVGDARRQLNQIVILGFFLPLVLYLLWVAVVHGAIARAGSDGLIAMANVAHTNSLLMAQLVAISHRPVLVSFSVVFVSICSLTGFLGVSVALMHGLADGLKVDRNSKARRSLALYTWLLPIIIVIYKPEIFLAALSYAGFCCVYIHKM